MGTDIYLKVETPNRYGTAPFEVVPFNNDPPLCWCGAPMIAAGFGKYPYPCAAQKKHPDAMVYIGCEAGHTSWTLKLETPKTRGTAPFKAVNFDNDSLTTTQQ